MSSMALEHRRPDTSHRLILSTTIGAFILLMTAAIFPPVVPIAGPLSLDDVLPLLATVLALAIMLFSPRHPRLDATVIAFALLAALGLLSSASNAQSLSDFGRLAGRATGRICFYFALVACTRFLLEKKSWQMRAVTAFVAAATAEAIFCLFAYQTSYRGPYGIGVVPLAGWSVIKGSFRVQGTFSGGANAYEVGSVSANFLASYLVLSAPVTAGLALYVQRPWVRIAIFFGMMLQLLALYLTYTRAALVALGAPILVFGWVLGQRKLAFMALLTAVAMTFAIPKVRTKLLGERHDRYALWWASKEITFDNPLAGVGDGNYEAVLYSDQTYHDTPLGPASTASHNSVLLSAAYHGIAGGCAQALLYALMVVVSLRSMKSVTGRERFIAAGLIAALAGYLVHDQFNNLAYVPKVATQMWFLFALLLAIGAAHDPAPAPTPIERGRVSG